MGHGPPCLTHGPPPGQSNRARGPHLVPRPVAGPAGTFQERPCAWSGHQQGHGPAGFYGRPAPAAVTHTGSARVVGTLSRPTRGDNAIDGLSLAFCAGLFDDNTHSSITGVVVYSLSPITEGGASLAVGGPVGPLPPIFFSSENSSLADPPW
jgi:hypothetical protein